MVEEIQVGRPSGGKYLVKRERGKKRKKWILLILLLVAAGGLAVHFGMAGKTTRQTLNLQDTTVLSYRDIQDSISASGMVESASTTTVYSTMAYPVMAVYAEVGDRVEEGQVLAELDAKNLINQIITQEIGLDTAEKSSAVQLESAQSSYNNLKSGIEQGLNQSINSADTQVDTAYDNYIRAKNTYERYVKSIELGENTAVIGAETALRSARVAYETAAEAYNKARSAYLEAKTKKEELEAALEQAVWESLQQPFVDQEEQKGTEEGEIAPAEPLSDEMDSEGGALQQEIDTLRAACAEAEMICRQQEAAMINAESAMDNAAAAYDTQQASYNAALTAADHSLVDYQAAMESAWKAYQSALTNLTATKKSVHEQLQSLGTNVEAARITADNAAGKETLRQLEETLEDTKITAPCAGVVTAVYAEVGGSGSGLLFIIEDIDDLVIDSSVKGYDIGAVREGLKTVIRSDATGDQRFEGTVSSIGPTAKKAAPGTMQTASDPVFAVEVTVKEKNTGLRIGMEAELDYILAEAKHVLAVPYDAVYLNMYGDTCILTAVPLEKDLYRIEELTVTTGLDDDLDMEVFGDGVEEGVRVIHEPAQYLSFIGQTVVGVIPDLRGVEAIMGGMMS